MDVVFVDVGFGTCNVILTGSGEAIVLDAGKRTKEPHAVLNQFTVSRISHLIVSHWHDDHYGGATGLLRNFASRIGEVWFPPDPAFKTSHFWSAIVAELDAGRLGLHQIMPLVIEGAGTRRIWSSAAFDAELLLVSPSYMEASRGGATGDSNSTCGVLVLRVGSRYVVFAGDASLAQWQEVGRRMAVPIQSEALAVSHHAGMMWPPHWRAPQISAALDNLYSKIVRPQIAIISAGTRPGTKHPREDVVAALRRAGADIMCTQMTGRCTSDLESARVLQRSLPVLAKGRSSREKLQTGKMRHSNHVACAGSVVVELRASGAIVHQLAPHRAFVGRIPTRLGQTPLCRS